MGDSTQGSTQDAPQDAPQEFKPRSDLAVWVGTGRLTGDPEAHGDLVTAGLAVHVLGRKDEEQVQETVFMDMKLFGDEDKRKDYLSYLHVGREVDVVGSIETGEYELKIGGEPVFYDEEEDSPVIMRPLELLVDDLKYKPVSAREGKLHLDRNVWVGIGRLTSPPERHGRVVTFGLAVNAVHNVEGKPVEFTTFYDVKVFGRVGGDCLRYLEVGREVKIRGTVKTGAYNLKIGGEPVFYDEEQQKPVIMRPLQLLTSSVQFGR